jgi:hypothetical protein
MTLNLDLNDDFLDVDDEKLPHFPNSPFERIGPWV